MTTNPANTSIKPPYPANTVNPPLSAAQIAAISAYFKQVYANDPTTAQSLIDGLNGSEGASSLQFSIQTYNYLASGNAPIQATTPPPGAVTTTKTPGNWIAWVEYTLQKLTDGAFWLRVGEFLIAGVLIAVGLAHITGKSNTVSEAAADFGKVAPALA